MIRYNYRRDKTLILRKEDVMSLKNVIAVVTATIALVEAIANLKDD